MRVLIQKAKENNPEAQYCLAKKYLEGDGVRKNVKKAISWLVLASDNGHKQAMMRLGELYWCGSKKIHLDENKALELFKQSAKLGLTKAQYLLGAIFATDKARYDPEEAAVWYKMAADSGDTQALYNLGVMYQLGEGVKKDIHLGESLINKSYKSKE